MLLKIERIQYREQMELLGNKKGKSHAIRARQAD
jgi:hypothetical protein